MKKFIALVSAVLLFATLFIACAEEEKAPDGYKLNSREGAPYKFYVPTQWSPNNAGGIDSAFYSSDDSSTVTMTYYIREDGDNSIDDVWKKFEKQYTETYGEYKFSACTDSVLGGVNAKTYGFDAKIGGVKCSVRQIIAIKGGYFFVMTYMAVPDKFESHLEAFNNMAGVFEFK